MPKEKQTGWDGTPLGEVAQEAKDLSDIPPKRDKGQVFENLHRPEDNDDHPNYPADRIWR